MIEGKALCVVLVGEDFGGGERAFLTADNGNYDLSTDFSYSSQKFSTHFDPKTQ